MPFTIGDPNAFPREQQRRSLAAQANQAREGIRAALKQQKIAARDAVKMKYLDARLKHALDKYTVEAQKDEAAAERALRRELQNMRDSAAAERDREQQKFTAGENVANRQFTAAQQTQQQQFTGSENKLNRQNAQDIQTRSQNFTAEQNEQNRIDTNMAGWDANDRAIKVAQIKADKDAQKASAKAAQAKSDKATAEAHRVTKQVGLRLSALERLKRPENFVFQGQEGGNFLDTEALNEARQQFLENGGDLNHIIPIINYIMEWARSKKVSGVDVETKEPGAVKKTWQWAFGS